MSGFTTDSTALAIIRRTVFPIPIGRTPGFLSRAIRRQARRGEIDFGSTYEVYPSRDHSAPARSGVPRLARPARPGVGGGVLQAMAIRMRGHALRLYYIWASGSEPTYSYTRRDFRAGLRALDCLLSRMRCFLETAFSLTAPTNCHAHSFHIPRGNCMQLRRTFRMHNRPSSARLYHPSHTARHTHATVTPLSKKKVCKA